MLYNLNNRVNDIVECFNILLILQQQIRFQLLIEAGAKPSMEDLEGNTPLHAKCYGETGQLSELGAIKLLINNGAKLTSRNNRVNLNFCFN